MLDRPQTQDTEKNFYFYKESNDDCPARKLVTASTELFQFHRVIRSACFTVVKNPDATPFWWMDNHILSAASKKQCLACVNLKLRRQSSSSPVYLTTKVFNQKHVKCLLLSKTTS